MKASQLALQNVKDILTILHWNESNNIRVFRIGSEPLPRSNDPLVGYSIDQLPDSVEIIKILKSIGKFAYDHKHLLSFHPGQFVCIGSSNESVRQMGILALERENEVADIICSEYKSHLPINIHVGSSYGLDFLNTSNRFINSFNSLSPTLKYRLTVENDDKVNGWSVHNLFYYLSLRIDIPIVFDVHHWKFCNDYKSIDDNKMYNDFLLAYSTWHTNMQVHYSESSNINKLIPKHSEYCTSLMPKWLNEFNDIHIHIEAKQKELAVLQYKKLIDF